MILPILFIKDSTNKGKGVFTAAAIPENTTIEISPVLVFDEAERATIEKTLLYNYIFEWGTDYKGAALGMGYISIYNHSYLANCMYEMDFDDNTMSIITVQNIKAGEELFINYNATPDDETPIWFETN